MFRDRQYVVRDGEIVIVDEFTGRLGEGRKWRAGIHQAVEAKEGVEITFATNQAARITVQDFFLRYERLGGMTGTASTSAGELRKIYKVPRRCRCPRTGRRFARSCRRSCSARPRRSGRRSSTTSSSSIALGRPVLIGTRSIDKSETAGATCSRRAASSTTVLNARHVAQEAEIVAAAGQPGKVTVATNMAGRGTDIRLGAGRRTSSAACTSSAPSCTRRSASTASSSAAAAGRAIPARIASSSRSTTKSCSPASARRRPKRLKEHGERLAGSGPLSGFESLFRKAQRRVERRHFRDRKVLLYHEKERQKMQRQMGQDPYLGYAGLAVD